MTFLVFANGDMDETEWVRPYLDAATVVIAADGGVRHLLRLERQPDVVVGDLDSFPEGVREKMEAQGTAFIEHPAAKDETDLELALLYATAHFDGAGLIIGGLGGRVDQMLANIFLLLHPAFKDRELRFLTGQQQLWLVHDRTTISGERGDKVSLLPLAGDVHIEATAGLEWPLFDETLASGPARGISNVMTRQTATVTVAAGNLLCVHTKKGWQR